MNDNRSPGKLLSNKWDNVKCKGHLRTSWVAQVYSLKKQFIEDLHDIEIILKVFDKREFEWFEMAMQHKSKMHIHRELKQESMFK